MKRKVFSPHYMNLLFYKAIADLRSEASRNYIGILWWFIEPMLYMCVFYVVFNFVFQRSEGIPFLLIGLVVWKWFSSTFTSSANSIAANIRLINQVYLPKYIFPASVMIANTIKFFLVFSLLIIFIISYGTSPGITWLATPVILLVLFMVIAACGFFASIIVTFVPDFKMILDNGLMLVFFLSGIFFNIDSIPPKLKMVVLLNPIALLIHNLRVCLIYEGWPNWIPIAAVALISMLGIAFAQALMQKYDRLFPKAL